MNIRELLLSMDTIMIQSTVAVGLVAIYSWVRYNTPLTARSETTWSKFLLGRLAYVAIVLSIFGSLLATPGLAESVANQVAQREGSAWHEVHEKLALPLIIALALTFFLSEVPFLSRADQALRRYFHRIAAIPREQRVRIAQLWQSRLTNSDELRSEVVKRFDRQGLPPEAVALEEDRDSPTCLWTRITVHVVRLEKLGQDRRYAEQLLFSDAYKDFQRRYDHLAQKARHVLPLLAVDSTEKASRLLRDEFVEQAKALLWSLYDLASRLILQCCRTEMQRRRCTAALGLQPATDERKDGWSLHEVLWLILLVFGFLVVTIGHLGLDHVATIAVILASAVVIALLLQPEPGEGVAERVPPVGRYLSAGSLAVATWFLMTALFELIRDGALVGFLAGDHSARVREAFSERWPWSLMAGATAVLTSALTDPWLEKRVGSLRQRFSLGKVVNLLDGLIMAMAFAATAYFIVSPQLQDLDRPRWTVALIASGVGWLLGLFVPIGYRHRVSEQKEKEEWADGPGSIPLASSLGI